jgi:biopolymer transport protein ExbB/TolQ
MWLLVKMRIILFFVFKSETNRWMQTRRRRGGRLAGAVDQAKDQDGS